MEKDTNAKMFKKEKTPHRLSSKGITEFYQAMPENRKRKDNPVQAYREYYTNNKRQLAKWKKRHKPE